MYEVLLEGYSTMKNEHITFYIRHVTWKREKIYSSQFFQNIPFRIAWKTT